MLYLRKVEVKNMKTYPRSFGLLVLFILSSLVVSCSSQGNDQPDQLIYMVIDQTSVWPKSARKNYLQMLDDVKNMVVQEKKGLDLVAVKLTEDSTEKDNILSIEKQKLHWYDNEKATSIKAKVKEENKRVLSKINKALNPIARNQTTGVASPIFEKLFDIANDWESSQSFSGKRLIIFSDMVQYSDGLIFREGLDKIFKRAEQKNAPDLIVNRIEKMGLLPDFKGADVKIYIQADFDAHLGSIRNNHKKRAALSRLNHRKHFIESIWKDYFEKANAGSVVYK